MKRKTITESKIIENATERLENVVLIRQLDQIHRMLKWWIIYVIDQEYPGKDSGLKRPDISDILDGK